MAAGEPCNNICLRNVCSHQQGNVTTTNCTTCTESSSTDSSRPAHLTGVCFIPKGLSCGIKVTCGASEIFLYFFSCTPQEQQPLSHLVYQACQVWWARGCYGCVTRRTKHTEAGCLLQAAQPVLQLAGLSGPLTPRSASTEEQQPWELVCIAWTNLYSCKWERAAFWIPSDKCCFPFHCNKSSSQIKERRKKTQKKRFLSSHIFQWWLLLAYSQTQGQAPISGFHYVHIGI